MNYQQWIPLSIPRTLSVVLICLLGVNGLIQVHLQRDMATKSVQLNDQVHESKDLTKNMKAGLGGLNQLDKATTTLSSTLSQIEGTTSQMDSGITLLNTTVAGILHSIQAIGSTTNASSESLSQINESTGRLLAVLEAIHRINSQSISRLSSMVNDESAINTDIAQMNQKTAALP